jgi:hypothetical protein
MGIYWKFMGLYIERFCIKLHNEHIFHRDRKQYNFLYLCVRAFIYNARNQPGFTCIMKDNIGLAVPWFPPHFGVQLSTYLNLSMPFNCVQSRHNKIWLPSSVQIELFSCFCFFSALCRQKH